MYEVFRDVDSAKVGMIDGILKESGIPTLLKNWTGSNIIEIPIPSLYPTVYVLNASQVDAAKKQIKEFFEAVPEEQEEWNCTECGEIVDGYLSECWACQNPKES